MRASGCRPGCWADRRRPATRASAVGSPVPARSVLPRPCRRERSRRGHAAPAERLAARNPDGDRPETQRPALRSPGRRLHPVDPALQGRGLPELDRAAVSRWGGFTGHVDFEFTVERDGSVSALRMLKSSGTQSLDRAAQYALSSSRYLPAPGRLRSAAGHDAGDLLLQRGAARLVSAPRWALKPARLARGRRGGVARGGGVPHDAGRRRRPRATAVQCRRAGRRGLRPSASGILRRRRRASRSARRRRTSTCGCAKRASRACASPAAAGDVQARGRGTAAPRRDRATSSTRRRSRRAASADMLQVDATRLPRDPRGAAGRGGRAHRRERREPRGLPARRRAERALAPGLPAGSRRSRRRPWRRARTRSPTSATTRRRAIDLCATPACQVYRGQSSEHPLSDRAVAETKGVVATFRGKPINAYYTSTCGGHTEDGDDDLRRRRALPARRRVPAGAEGAAVDPHDGGAAARRRRTRPRRSATSPSSRRSASLDTAERRSRRACGLPRPTRSCGRGRSRLKTALHRTGCDGAAVVRPRPPRELRAPPRRVRCAGASGRSGCSRRATPTTCSRPRTSARLTDPAERQAMALLVHEGLLSPAPDNTLRPDAAAHARRGACPPRGRRR